jgi:hypothetical protein
VNKEAAMKKLVDILVEDMPWTYNIEHLHNMYVVTVEELPDPDLFTASANEDKALALFKKALAEELLTKLRNKEVITVPVGGDIKMTLSAK